MICDSHQKRVRVLVVFFHFLCTSLSSIKVGRLPQTRVSATTLYVVMASLCCLLLLFLSATAVAGQCKLLLIMHANTSIN